MTFTVEQWQESAKTKYQEFSQWLGRRAHDAGLTAYGSLTTLTLWPIVEYTTAAAQTGQPLPFAVGMALGSIAGNVGTNLLAARIDTWYQQAAAGEAPTEDDVLDWLLENVASQADLQTALDQMLEKLEAIPQAEAALPADQWQPFGQQLRQELEQLGSLPRFEATLIGSGVLAQGEGATAIGNQGVQVSGSVNAPINTGKIEKQVQTQAYYEHYHEADPGTAVDSNSLQRAYLGRVVEQARLLTLSGIDRADIERDDPHTPGDKYLPLTSVYTALLTTGSEQRDEPGLTAGFHEMIPGLLGRGRGKTRPLSALQQLAQQPHLVLLGDPGSGKTTFVNFVAACLAGEVLGHAEINIDLLTRPLPDDDGEDQAEKQPWPHGPLLPLPIVLRDLAAAGLPPADQPATAEHLWAYLANHSHTPDFIPFLRQTFEQTGGLLLLDGLDEVPEADKRRVQIQQLVADLKATLPLARILVTSRLYAYWHRQEAWQLAGFAATLLAPFTWGQIRRFIDRWYAYSATRHGWSQTKAEQEAILLRETIADRPELRDLAERPLLLTLMATLHAWRGGTLPGKRALLYDDTVDLLLNRWEAQRKVYHPQTKELLPNKGLAEVMKVTKEALRRMLEKLAYEAHAQQPDPGSGQPADLPEATIVEALLALSQREDLQPRVLTAYLRDRAGLLVDRGGGVYSFPHRTFQEFLAACYAADRNHNEEMTTAARQDPSRWREVLLLSVGHANIFRGAVWDFVPFLCWEEPEMTADGRLAEAELWGAQLAGLALLEVETDPAQVGRRDRSALGRVRERLTVALADERLPATERAQAAVSLAYLGDTRAAVLAVDAMPFCYVPPGEFRMGADEVPQHDNPNVQDMLDSVKPAHPVDLAYAYWLGQHPVTNAQFQMFADDGGYEKEGYWQEAIEHGVWQEGQIRGYTWLPAKNGAEWLTRDRPYDYGRPFNLPNHPVVGITWYEALAFTRWLTERWRAADVLPDRWQVVLPSEAEWEKGARGGLMLPESPLVAALPALAGLEPTVRLVDGSLAAEPTWGPETANYRDTKIKATSGAGCFPQGQSPYGCQDMLGNVWEWTRSLYGRYDGEKSRGTDRIIFDPQYQYPYQADDGRERLDRDDDWARVLRGSSYEMDEDWLRCAYRLRNHPNYGFGNFGFRVCVSPFAIRHL